MYVAHYYGIAEAWIPIGVRFRHKYMFNGSAGLLREMKKGPVTVRILGKARE